MATNTNKLMLSGIYQMGKTIRENITFTGLQDTPPNYAFKQYLESTTDGLQYVNAHDLATTLGSIPKQYQDGVNFEGQLVNSGCDLYLVCNGQWIKYYSYNGILSSDSSDIPDCVNTVEELALYEQYKDYTTSEYGTNLFDEELNEPNPSTDFHNVCLFSSDSNSKVSIDETTYKWGIFNGDQTINLTALPGNGGGFSHWTGYGATFGDFSNRNTTTFVDKDLSITGVFNSVNTFDFANYDSNNAERILTNEAGYGHNFGTAVALYGNMLVATTFEQAVIDDHGYIDLEEGRMPYRTYDGNRVGETFIRQHLYTFIYNPATQLWDQVGKQELTKTYSEYLAGAYNETTTWNEYSIHTMKLVGDTLFCGMPIHNQFFPNATTPTRRCGAVKIFRWSNSSWVETQTLQQPTSGVLNPLGVQYSYPDDSAEIGKHLYTSQFGSCLDVREDKLLVVPGHYPYDAWYKNAGRILIYTKSTNGNWELTDTVYPDSAQENDYLGLQSCFGTHKNQIISRKNSGTEITVYEKQHDGTWMEVMNQPFTINISWASTPNRYQSLFFVDGSLYVKYSVQASHRLYKVDISGANWTLGDYIELPSNHQLDNGDVGDHWTVRSISINGGVIASSALLDNNIYVGAGTVYINRL
jgi:hypothetical protein